MVLNNNLENQLPQAGCTSFCKRKPFPSVLPKEYCYPWEYVPGKTFIRGIITGITFFRGVLFPCDTGATELSIGMDLNLITDTVVFSDSAKWLTLLSFRTSSQGCLFSLHHFKRFLQNRIISLGFSTAGTLHNNRIQRIDWWIKTTF